MPSRNERRKASPRACGSGVKPSSAITASTFSRVSSRTKGDLLITRETVFFETSAMRAMSLMVARRPSGARTGAALGSLISSDSSTSCSAKPCLCISLRAGRRQRGGSGAPALPRAVQGVGRQRRHEAQIPLRLVERPAGRLARLRIAADLVLVVDDLAAPLGHLGDQQHVALVAVPR